MFRIKKLVLPIITGVLLSSSAVRASNLSTQSSVDRSFNFYFSGYNSTDCTGHQPKENDSSVYMYYVSGTPGLIYDAHVVGYNNFYLEKDCSYDSSTTSKFSYKYRFHNGDRRLMYNYVRENGYQYAGIRAVGHGKGTATGVWSPDSVYEAGLIPESDYIK